MKGRTFRRGLPLPFALVLCLALVTPARADGLEPGHGRGRPPGRAAITDGDHDLIADGLAHRMAGASGSTRFDVVATFSGRPALVSAARALSGRVDRTFSLIDGFAAHLTAGQVRALSRQPGLLRVEQNFAVHALMDAADRDYGTEAARVDFGVTGAGEEICLIDTGVDLGHEQLDSKAPIGWKDLVDDRPAPYDDNGHGTHVASIAVGDGVGGGSIAARFNGVAPGASLSAVKVLDATGFGDDALVVTAVQWCAARPSVDVISMSLGSDVASDGLDAVSQAVNAAVAGGKVVVAAAGNSGDAPGSITAPGSAAGAITVGAAADWSAPLNAPYRSEGPYLAPFSSRGPTVDGRVKPDIVAPGVTISAADAGSVSGYVVHSGTSMATPFVAGTAALLRELRPAWTPADVRAAIEGTALDVGAPGKDDEWGAGLLDGYEAVALAAGGTGETPFPRYRHLAGSVADQGTWTTSFTIAPADLGVPIAATITLEGDLECTIDLPPLGCLVYEFSPDLDAELLDPTGLVISDSTCGADDECGFGRQETLHTTPTEPGTYTIRIRPFAGAPNDGAGGSFSVDLFTGPLVGGPPPPDLTAHVGDLDGSSRTVRRGWRATVTVTVHDDAHKPAGGATVTGTWNGTASASCVTNAKGRCNLGKRVAASRASVAFAVTNVVLAGHGYAPGDNHDPDGSSDGTTIGIGRPA